MYFVWQREITYLTYQLEVGVTVVRSGGVDTVLVGDDLPEFGSDLVTALASLQVDDFPHFGSVVVFFWDENWLGNIWV